MLQKHSESQFPYYCPELIIETIVMVIHTIAIIKGHITRVGTYNTKAFRLVAVTIRVEVIVMMESTAVLQIKVTSIACL